MSITPLALISAITPVSLRDVKLNVLSDEKCAADVLPLEDYVNVNITLCARYQQAILSGCQVSVISANVNI